MSTVIIVKNFLKTQVTRDHLAKFFTFCVAELIISVPDQSDQSLGIAIVNFVNPASAEIAVQLSGAVFNDRAITIRSAPPNFITPSANPNDTPLPTAIEGEKTPATVFTRLISNGYTLHADLMEKYKSKVTEKVETKEVNDTRWEIFPPQGSILGSCAMMSAHGTYLRANSNGTIDLQEAAGPWETFTIHSYGESLISIRTHHGTYLSAPSGLAGSGVNTKKTAGASEQWVLIHHGGCDYSLQSTYGTYVRAYLGGEGGKVDLQPSMTSQWEVFKFIGREPNRSLKSCAFGTFVRAVPGPDGSKVDLKPNCGAWETFTIEKVEDKIIFQSMHNTYLCAHPGNNGRIESHSRQGLSEKWTMIVHKEQPMCYSFQSCHGTFMRATKEGTLNLRDCAVHDIGPSEKFLISVGIDVPIEKLVGAKISGKFASFGDNLKKATKK